jgi:uncharacterized protein (TIGR03085 family)
MAALLIRWLAYSRFMANQGLAARERSALCTLFERLGPDAPTLCEGWATLDLAAHLVARDTIPIAVPGLVITPLHPITARIEQITLDRYDYPEMIARLRNGPPLYGPFALPGASELFNLHEFYVHHEDVRRPNGLRPRRLSARLDAALWWRLRVFGPYLMRALRGLHVRVETPDGRSAVLLPGRGELVVKGPVGELFLFAFNRRDAAKVNVSGDDSALDRLSRIRLGP